ncbi:MAG TPA: RNA polymerase sigma factor [Solirubrobacteraceae bacterium]|jgi:RNA polymerase sigma factor (sigma-70 family)|nr:RNA polymerase sigma factor [Solirubrobacteraceae bacterium]
MSPAGFPRLPGVQSDQRLLALARDGDERAFEALVRRYRRALLRYCRRMGLSDSRAEDVVQQALLRAWLALERGGDVHAPKAWLYRTVHNTAVNALRSTRNHSPLEDGVPVGLAASAESDFESRVAVRQTLGDVAGLPRMQREAVVLTAFDGRSHEEIAVALGVSHGAVRGLLYRARATLRDAAAAFAPQPVLLWASGLLGRMTPGAAKLAELSAPAAGGDMGGALAKGAALAATAAVLAVGTGVVPLPRHLAHHSNAAAQALGITPASAEAQTGRPSLTGAGAPREGAASSTGSGPGRRSGSSRRPAGAPIASTPLRGSNGGEGSRRRGGEGPSSSSGDTALLLGGQEELSSGRGEATQPRSGSDRRQAPESEPWDSSHGGSGAPGCDHCSQPSGGGDTASHSGDAEPGSPATVAPGVSPPTASDVQPASSSEALAERHVRD